MYIGIYIYIYIYVSYHSMSYSMPVESYNSNLNHHDIIQRGVCCSLVGMVFEHWWPRYMWRTPDSDDPAVSVT